jgi:phosphoglycolate phosphatase-like HAD superfamily hydrolase
MGNLALFDIDDTLLKSTEAHRVAFEEGIRRMYKVETTVAKINPHGMTDQQIIVELLTMHGVDETRIKEKLDACIQRIISTFHEHIGSEDIVVLDGVRELLQELKRCDVEMGLLTGNLEPIARGKLERVGISHYFKVGGFGSDALYRNELVNLAVERASSGRPSSPPEKTFLFGDTPRDISAGKGAGVTTVGVATGIYSKRDLEEAGADHTFEDLRHTKQILELVK